MNRLLFDRETGQLGPNSLARLVGTSHLKGGFTPAPRFVFNGGDPGTNLEIAASSSCKDTKGERIDTRAHRGGVNALALERFRARM